MDNQLVGQLTLMGSSIKEHFYYIVYKKKNPPRKKGACTGQREGGRFSCINKRIIFHPVTRPCGDQKICSWEEEIRDRVQYATHPYSLGSGHYRWLLPKATKVRAPFRCRHASAEQRSVSDVIYIGRVQSKGRRFALLCRLTDWVTDLWPSGKRRLLPFRHPVSKAWR